MAVVLVLLAALFTAITVADVRERAVYVAHLALLVLLRVLAALGALAASVWQVGGSVPWLALPLSTWGFAPLAWQALAGVGVALLLWLMGAAVSKATAAPSVGRGDVLLIAACCMFLRFDLLEPYLLLVALAGVAMALFWRFARKSSTFPFAPALVWPCWAVLLVC